ncbi:Arc family DNA-binding protein [Aeromonas veronii]|uniref:Arc family DNA-binding protein n=1 Tax=Aeromonas veronii TaxID=654 RepID=UPI0013E0391B|nr:Arc family DNA-binding protein [Aeromonas veronii]QIF45221.1 Arc family DNA-binding protein [Aeromonas veronii]
MSREHQQMRVRLPPELRDGLEQMAKKNGRSMNAEIVYRLQRTFDEDTELAGSGVKVIDGLSIDRSALALPLGTVITAREIDIDDPRYTAYVRREEIQEVLDYIRQEMKNKKD